MKNRLTRIICSGVICVALACGFIPSAFSKVYADTGLTPAVEGNTTQLKGIASEKKQGEILDVPKIQGLNLDTDYTIVAKSPRGADVTSSINGERLLLTDIGVYTITYKINDKTETTYTYQTKVSGSYASLSFDQNTKAILPEKINNGFKDKIYLPMPNVLDSEGNNFEGLNVTVTVFKAAAVHKSINFTTSTTQEDMFFNLDNNYAGDYVITYKVKDETNTYTLTTKSYTINASPTFDTKYELSASLATSAPTTAVVGIEKTLPVVESINKKTNNSVSSYYQIKVLYLGEEYKEGNEKFDVTNEVIKENNIFTANKPGDYEISYNVYDVYGNKFDKLTFRIKEIKDSVAPTIMVVEPYSIENNEIPKTVNAVHKLPTVWGNSDIVLPAIFAEDNYSKNFSDFTFVRYIMNTSGEIVFTTKENSNKNLVINSSGSTDVSTSDFVDVKTLNGYNEFNLAPGSYKVYYKSTDKAGNEKEQYYSLKIQSDFFDDKTPTVKFNSTFPSTIVAGETFTFDAPIVSDDNDTRIDVSLKYTFGELDGSSNIIYYPLELNDDEKYEIKVPKTISDKDTLKIITTAIDDKGYVDGTATIVEKTMTVRNIKDTKSAEIKSIVDLGDLNGVVSGQDKVKINQKDKVKLPTISFKDDYISNLNVSITVSYEKDDKVQNVNVYDKTVRTIRDEIEVDGKIVRLDSGEQTVSGAYFYADRLTDYKITYTAKDAGNNVVMKSFIFSKDNINETVPPKLEGITNLPPALANETLEFGDRIQLPTPIIRDSNGDVIENAEYEVIVVSGPANYEFEYDYAYFTPKSCGTFYLRYVAQVGVTTLTSKDYKVEVSDTKKPIINVDSSVDMPKTLEKDTTVDIPKFSVEDFSELNYDKCYIKITSSKSSTRTIYMTADDVNFTYTFAYNTSYTISYYAEDIYGNSASTSFTVKVGDVQAPELTLKDDSKNAVTKFILNEEFKVNLDDFTIYDAIDKDLSKDDIKVVVMNTDTNKEVENLDKDSATLSYRFKFTEAGNYTISYTVIDSAGNRSESITYNFTVTETQKFSLLLFT